MSQTSKRSEEGTQKMHGVRADRSALGPVPAPPSPVLPANRTTPPPSTWCPPHAWFPPPLPENHQVPPSPSLLCVASPLAAHSCRPPLAAPIPVYPSGPATPCTLAVVSPLSVLSYPTSKTDPAPLQVSANRQLGSHCGRSRPARPFCRLSTNGELSRTNGRPRGWSREAGAPQTWRPPGRAQSAGTARLLGLGLLRWAPRANSDQHGGGGRGSSGLSEREDQDRWVPGGRRGQRGLRRSHGGRFQVPRATPGDERSSVEVPPAPPGDCWSAGCVPSAPPGDCRSVGCVPSTSSRTRGSANHGPSPPFPELCDWAEPVLEASGDSAPRTFSAPKATPSPWRCSVRGGVACMEGVVRCRTRGSVPTGSVCMSVRISGDSGCVYFRCQIHLSQGLTSLLSCCTQKLPFLRMCKLFHIFPQGDGAGSGCVLVACVCTRRVVRCACMCFVCACVSVCTHLCR